MRIRRTPNIHLIRNFDINLAGVACKKRITILLSSRLHLYSVIVLIGFGIAILFTTSSQPHYVSIESTILNGADTDSTSINLATVPSKDHLHLQTTLLKVADTSINTAAFTSPDIVLEWRDWTELEYTVNSIWGGSRFCRILKENIDQYYQKKRAERLQQQNTQQSPVVPGEPQNTEATIPIPYISILYEVSCYDLYKLSEHGTGNYIQVIYFMRMVVKFMPDVHIKLNVTCIENDSPEFYTHYVLPWFTGVWYTPSDSQRAQQIADIQRYNSSITNIEDERYCGHYKLNPTAVLYKEMQYDVRRMAIALVGTQPFVNDDGANHESREEVTDEIKKFLDEYIYEPTIPVNRYTRALPLKNITLSPGSTLVRYDSKTTNIVPLIQLQRPNDNVIFDDAVIHFRCGDLLLTDLEAYGFLTFNGYSRHISSSVRSIGILTQPFGTVKKSKVTEEVQQQSSITDQRRKMDTDHEIVARRCLTLVYAFKQYLEEKFPNASVYIRNDRKETVALAYARMVMAKQVVGSMSTFSIYPVIGTFGTGYYMRPKSVDPSCWVENDMYPVSIIQDLRTVIFDEDHTLLGRDPRELWNNHGDDVILQWFRNEGDT